MAEQFAGPSNRKVQHGSFLNRAGYSRHLAMLIHIRDRQLIRLTKQ